MGEEGRGGGEVGEEGEEGGVSGVSVGGQYYTVRRQDTTGARKSSTSPTKPPTKHTNTVNMPNKRRRAKNAPALE